MPGPPRASSILRIGTGHGSRRAGTDARWTGSRSWGSCCWPPRRERWSSCRPMARTSGKPWTRSPPWSRAGSERARDGGPAATGQGMELKGTGVSPGIALGRALIVERDAAPVFRLVLAPEEAEREVVRLGAAVGAFRAQLLAIKERLSREVGMPHAYIFDAHLLMLEDPLLLDPARTVIRDDRVNAEWALRTVSDQLHALFAQLTDAYLRERSTDLDDVLGRIQLNLRGSAEAASLQRLPGSFVLVAEDLTPSEAAELDWERVLAVVTDVGSSTYHTAIIARSLGIPAVVGLKDATRRIPPGSLVVVDGTEGEVVVDPSGPALAGFRAVQQEYRQEEARLQGTPALPAVTLDGVSVRLQANVEFPEGAATPSPYGGEGVGPFRSESRPGRAI